MSTTIARLAKILVLLVILALPVSVVTGFGPRRPDYPPVVGKPDVLSTFWHDQRWQEGDVYACALYAQVGVLEALGYDFRTELDAARDLGLRDGWYDPSAGAIGLGQILRERGVPFSVYGTPVADYLTPQRALARLQLELAAGHFPIVNVNAQALPYYRGSAITYHTLWITGMRLNEDGLITSIIANDSYRGPAVEYDPVYFVHAWGTPEFNYYAIFVQPPAPDTVLAS